MGAPMWVSGLVTGSSFTCSTTPEEGYIKMIFTWVGLREPLRDLVDVHIHHTGIGALRWMGRLRWLRTTLVSSRGDRRRRL